MNYLSLIGRENELFEEDIFNNSTKIASIISSSRFLVIGGSGSIGHAVTREIFKRDPKVLHVVDISENNMVELVRDLRSTVGYVSGDFKTFAVDCGSVEFEALIKNEGPYDYVFNLSALKHVRSEKDPFTLMRLIQVNILNTIKTMQMARGKNAKKYFDLWNGFTLFCLDYTKSNYPLLGSMSDMKSKGLLLEASYCVNTTDNGNHCHTQEKIDDFTKQINFETWSVSTKMDFSKYY